MLDMKQYKSLQRLYVPDADLAAGNDIALSEAQHHYLRNVMRREAGQQLRIFNGTQGEWLVTIKEITKKNAIVECLEVLAEQKTTPPIFVLAAIVKKEAFDIMIEKAAELGAAHFIPVITDHTVVHRMNLDRARATAIEACEQCERMDIMQVDEPLPLKDVLRSWDKSKNFMFCIEREKAQPVATVLANATPKPQGILVGPEGGFSAQEIELIGKYDFALPVSLGPRILRAETALIAGLGCLQAIAGDWQESG